MFIRFQETTSTPLGKRFLQSIWQFVVLLAIAVVLGFSINQFRDNRLPLFGDWSMGTRLITPSGIRLNVSLIEAKNLFLRKKSIFIDARPKDDYEKGHIRGARSLPWREVDQRFIEVMKGVSSDTPIITYCDGETCDLSHKLAAFLIEMGFNNVKILVNGWSKWQKADLPIDTEGSD